jgi:Sec-independent protein secretion pathway component TatC
VVVIAALAAVFTPTNDPATMLLMAIPMSGLYLVSIVLVKAFEPDANGKSDGKIIQKFMVSLVPLLLFSIVSF